MKRETEKTLVAVLNAANGLAYHVEEVSGGSELGAKLSKDWVDSLDNLLQAVYDNGDIPSGEKAEEKAVKKSPFLYWVANNLEAID